MRAVLLLTVVVGLWLLGDAGAETERGEGRTAPAKAPWAGSAFVTSRSERGASGVSPMAPRSVSAPSTRAAKGAETERDIGLGSLYRGGVSAGRSAPVPRSVSAPRLTAGRRKVHLCHAAVNLAREQLLARPNVERDHAPQKYQGAVTSGVVPDGAARGGMRNGTPRLAALNTQVGSGLGTPTPPNTGPGATRRSGLSRRDGLPTAYSGAGSFLFLPSAERIAREALAAHGKKEA